MMKFKSWIYPNIPLDYFGFININNIPFNSGARGSGGRAHGW